MKKTHVSPAKASESQLIRMARDDKTIGDYWMRSDGFNVSIYHQKSGFTPNGGITIPRGVFNKLVEWYNKPQKYKS